MGTMSFIYTRNGSRTLDWTSERERGVEKTGSGARTRGNENQPV